MNSVMHKTYKSLRVAKCPVSSLKLVEIRTLDVPYSCIEINDIECVLKLLTRYFTQELLFLGHLLPTRKGVTF